MKERFEVLDVFRGIFASLVVLFHLSAFSATPVINNNFVRNADLFVDFFFILSGFVIAYSYQFITTGADLKKFYKKRFLRLYPLHFVVFIAFVLIELLKGWASHYVHVNKITNESNNIYTAVTNLFLVNSVKWPSIHDVSWNIASWSISAEMIAYLVFGLTMMLINRAGLTRIKAVVYALVIAAAASALYWLTGGFRLVYSFDYGFLRGITGFFVGVLCYTTYARVKPQVGQWGKGAFHVAETLFMATILITVLYGEELKPYGFMYEVLFFVTILVFAFERGWISDLLKKSPILHTTGKYSYSIYMTHTLMLSLFNIVFFRVLKFPPSAYAYLFIPNYLLIFWVSAWTFKNIEMRFNQVPQHKGKKTWWLW
ncbi:acyltransferase [Mucilaginibacter sp. Bleaf8]|uniref:acyltransferase family protein n=1 Tax=Mucilaginibacter sp. Bleaf8 TaxID=2834430 RepID=UPI001BCE4A82|nr:acyltransferase [Mucilaginibacter sp. Bleaf8]MBS7566253.1 acyltransferase [Mucilaginibacter sp. Bleaf8]